MSPLGTLEPHLPRFQRAVQMAGAGSLGWGLVLWIAANWDSIGRMQKFGLVGGTMLVFALVGAFSPAWRRPAALGAFLSIGALFALFGQTYQTGADPWQLFALWAALGLPLAIAARHDVVFVPWLAVAFVALHLVVASTSAFFAHPRLGETLPIWGGGIALVAALYVFNRSSIGAGAARWAVQLGAFVLASLIGGVAAPAVFDRLEGAGVFWLGVALLVGLIAVCALLKPREFLAMAVFTLTLDIILIVKIGYAILNTTKGVTDGWLLMAISAAAIVTPSGWFLMRLAPFRRRDDAAPSAGPPRPSSGDGARLTWPAVVFSGIGAVIAAIPFYVFLGMTFGSLLSSGPALLVIGAIMVALATVGLRVSRQLGFVQQFAFIALMSGLGLCTAGLFVALDVERSKIVLLPFLVMAALTVGLARLIPVGWINAVLGACGAAFTGAAIWGELAARKLLSPVTGAPSAAIALALALTALHALWSSRAIERAAGDRARGQTLASYLSGASAFAIIALMGSAGRTFLAPALSPVGGSEAIPELQTGWLVLQGISAICALCGCFLALRRFGALASPLPLVVSAVLVAFSAVSPNFGPTILFASVLAASRSRALLGLSAVAALWIIGTFYYWLGWPLANKAYLLAALGLVLIAAALLTEDPGASPDAASERGRAWLSPAVAALLLLAGPAVAAGIAILGVRDNENVIATGQKIYLRTVPRDPRSLVQGDFMALNFDGGRMSRPIMEVERELYAVAEVDSRGVATPKEHAETRPKPKPGEIVFPLRWKGGRWIVVTDAWHFKEGAGPRFAAARYGEFRLRSDGRMLLVGLADEALKPLQ